MRRFIASLLIICFTLSGLGCATSKQTGALTGAAVGAGAGAVIFKDPRAGAIIGGIVGAIAGAVIGDYIDEQKKNRRESVREIKYKPSQGNIVRIEDTTIEPVRVKPGETVGLKTSYYVLSPAPVGQVKIVESRVVTYNDKPVTEPFIREVRKEQGLTSSTMKLPLPNDAAEGEYTVITTIDCGQKRDQSISKFYVQEI